MANSSISTSPDKKILMAITMEGRFLGSRRNVIGLGLEDDVVSCHVNQGEK